MTAQPIRLVAVTDGGHQPDRSMTATTPTVMGAVLQYLRVRSQRHELAPITLQSVRPLLMRFATAVGPDRSVSSLSRRQALRWWDSLHGTPSTLRVALGSVRTFLGWCVEQGWLRLNPLRGVKSPREARRVPVTMSPEAVGLLLERAPDARARAILTVMVQAGLRCTEVSRLRMEHVDWRQRTMLVHGKGGHQRVLPITAEAAEALAAYLREHPAPGHGPVFRVYARGGHDAMDAGTLSNYVSRWMRAAGVKGRTLDGISAHALRRTMASDLLDGGANLRQVQDALGHAHLSTTEVYLRRVTGEDLRVVMEGRRYSGQHRAVHSLPGGSQPEAQVA